MLNKVIIGSTERGILFRDKQFVRVLGPGRHYLLSLLGSYSVQIFDIVKNPELQGAIASFLLKENSETRDRYLMKVQTGPREVLVLYRDAQATDVIGPGEERLFWKGIAELREERIDIRESFQLEPDLLRDLSKLPDGRGILRVRVPEQNRGILMDSGVLLRELAPGNYGYFSYRRELSASVYDTRVTPLEVGGQEMLTRDKVTLRVNLSVSFRIADIAKAIRALSDMNGEIYRTAQLVLRQAVGEKTLDELLESKEALNKALASEMSKTLDPYGIEIQRVGVKDIVLPGDMRILLNQVVEAEKAAQAQNIRRREETAATRSLLNTARLMEDNPVLMRLKEIEAVERISGKIEKLTVFDGFKGVMHGLVNLDDK